MFYKRQITISGKPDASPDGYALLITDSDTGDVIPFIGCIDLHLEPTELIVAHVRYVEHDEHDSPIMKEGKLVEHWENVSNPTVFIGALETLPPLEKLVYEAILDVLCCVTTEYGYWTADSKRASGIADKLIAAIKQLEV